jgi:hypothetical protein
MVPTIWLAVFQKIMPLPNHEGSTMRGTQDRNQHAPRRLVTGVAIVGTWCVMIASLATGVAAPAVTVALYLVLLTLIATALPLFRGFVTSMPVEGLLAWGMLLAVLSITAVVAAPLVGLILIAGYFRRQV